MTDAEKNERDRKLRLLRSAAASALFNDATPEEAREAFEAGLQEAFDNVLYRGPRPQDERAAA